jgi:hypothetical protein
MITQEHTKEGLSRAYLQAVAAMAGMNISNGCRSHDYGIDGSFHEVCIVNGKRVDSGFSIEFQLKATSLLRVDSEHIKYDLDADTQRCLVNRAGKPRATPGILIVYDLPKPTEEWLESSVENMILRRCCYWVAPKWEPTTNISTVTIEIPKNQILTHAALQELMKKISNGEQL